PRSFSLFFIEKQFLDASSFSYLPKIKTHGIRGADISGISFHDCFIPDSALVGPQGFALESTLKAFQISRTIMPATILGAADTALRSTLRFALSRRLYNGSVFSIPEARRVLVDAFIQLLVCDCVALAAARSLHLAPSQMSVSSAVAKFFVPSQIERAIADLAVVMGARHFLREGHDFGLFQKFMRESAALGAFHLGGYLNLSLIGHQMRSMANYGAKSGLRNSSELETSLESIFSLTKPVPEFNPQHLELFNRGRDDITQGMAICRARLYDLQVKARVDTDTAGILIAFADDIISEFATQERRLANIEQRYGNAFNQSPELFALARRHCTLHAAASCLWMWLFNRDHLSGFFARGEWLIESLDRLMMTVRPPRHPIPSAYTERIAEELLELHRNNRLFSIFPIKLAG
ncbi:MAG: acyl-CoA dehydrogenase family protein, partial [Blastocatellia bacterium]